MLFAAVVATDTPATIEVGGNLLQLGLALIGVATLLVTSIFAYRNSKLTKAAAADSKTAADQSTHASSQLKNNGGSTALDKLEKGQTQILDVLKFHDDRLTRMEVTLSRPAAPTSTPLPPPPAPAPTYQLLPTGPPSVSPIARIGWPNGISTNPTPPYATS